MGFQHAMFAAEVAVAEAAVSDDALGEFTAFFEAAAGFPGRCHVYWGWFGGNALKELERVGFEESWLEGGSG